MRLVDPPANPVVYGGRQCLRKQGTTCVHWGPGRGAAWTTGQGRLLQEDVSRTTERGHTGRTREQTRRREGPDGSEGRVMRSELPRGRGLRVVWSLFPDCLHRYGAFGLRVDKQSAGSTGAPTVPDCLPSDSERSRFPKRTVGCAWRLDTVPRRARQLSLKSCVSCNSLSSSFFNKMQKLHK